MTEAYAECYSASCSHCGGVDCADSTEAIRVPVGTTIAPWNYAKNNGDEANAIMVLIYKDGVKKVELQKWCSVGGYVNGNADGAYSFVMPDAQVSLVFKGQHAKNGEWQAADYTYIITLAPEVTPSLTISPTTRSSPAAGEAFTITVTSNIAWMVGILPSWITVYPGSGSGNGSVYVTVAANSSTLSRIGTIPIAGGSINRACAVTQAGAGITCTGGTSNFPLPETGCDLLIFFDADHDGVISPTEKDNAWEAEMLGHITHQEASFVEDAYNAGSINALCYGCFVVPSLVISPTTHSSPAAGETFTITVTSNIDWTVVNVDVRPWISFTPASGSGNGTITVTVAKNLLAERTGTIRVAGSGMTPTCTITQASGLLDTGSISVSSTPGDANIFVKPSGHTVFYDTGYNTPAIGSIVIGGLPVGSCDVKLTKAGYKDAVKIVTIIKDTTTTVPHFTFEEEVEGFSINLDKVEFDYMEDPEWTRLEISSQYIDSGGNVVDLGVESPSKALYVVRYKSTGSLMWETFPVWDSVGKKFFLYPTLMTADVFHIYLHFLGDDALGIPEQVSSKTIELDAVTNTWELIDTPDEYKPIEKKDTVICDFDILDAACKSVTDLVVGGRYTVRAWLCEKDVLGIGGCKALGDGCASEDEVSGGVLDFRMTAKVIETLPATDVNGYAEVGWIPSDDPIEIGTYDVKLAFAGITGYNACESTTKTITVKKNPYTINVTVKDENGTPIEGAYVDIDRWDYLTRTEKKCTDVAVYVGECTEEEWKEDGYNVVTNSEGKASIGLPEERAVPAEPEPLVSWIIRVGKPGYLNPTTQHEEWCDDQTVKEEYAGPFEHNLEFTLTFITEEDKFVVTVAPEFDLSITNILMCTEIEKVFGLLPIPGTFHVEKTVPPSHIVEFTSADGLEEGKLYAFTMYPISIWDQIASGQYYEFRGITKRSLSKLTIVQSAICGLFGIDDVDKCNLFCLEFYDPAYVANTISIIVNHHNLILDELQEPVTLDYVMLPLIIAGSALPFVPVGKLGKSAGLFLRAAKKDPAMKIFIDDAAGTLHKAGHMGTHTQVDNLIAAVKKGDVTAANNALNDILVNPSRTPHEILADFKKIADESDDLVKNANAKTSVKEANKVLTDGHASVIADVADDVHHYRFDYGNDIRENLFLAAIENAKRHTKLTPTELSSIVQLAKNNPENMATVLKSLPDADYTALEKVLRDSGATTELELVSYIRWVSKDKVLDDAGMDALTRILANEDLARITGTDKEIAEAFIKEFPTLTGERVLAEMSLMPKSFKKAYPGVVDAAVARVMKTKGIGALHARTMVHEGKVGWVITDIIKKTPRFFADHPVFALSTVITWFMSGLCPMWFYEETPQAYSLPIYAEIKNNNFVEAISLMPSYKDYIDGLDDLLPLCKILWFPWISFFDRAMIMHLQQYHAYELILGLTTVKPDIDETYVAKVTDIIDGDTIDVGVPTSEWAEWRQSFTTWVVVKKDIMPTTTPDIPLNMRVRFLGFDAQESKKDNFKITRQTDFKGGEVGAYHDIWWGDQALFDEIYTWMAENCYGSVTLLSDSSRQWDQYNRFLAAPMKDTVDISEEELKLGYGPVRFYLPNKVVDVERQSKYLAAETIAEDANLGVWKFKGVCSCFFDKATYNLNDDAELRYYNAPSDGILKIEDPDGTIDVIGSVEGTSYKTKKLTKEGTWKLTLTGTDCSDDDTAVVSESVVCPPPEASFTVSSNSIIVGESVVFTDTSKGGGTQKIKSWLWDFGDGATSTVHSPTHTFTKVCDPCTVTLTVTNDCVPAKSDSASDTIIVSPYIPPPPKGDLTIEVYESRDFTTALKVEHIYLDGIKISSGASAASKTNLLVSDNPYTVRVQFKETNQKCYADIPDECSDACTFDKINIVADTVTILKVCPARSTVFSANCVATIYAKPYMALDTEYKVVTGPTTMAFGTYDAKFTEPTHETVIGIITISDSGAYCEAVEGEGTCYNDTTPPVDAIGIYCTSFIIRGLLKYIPVEGELIAYDDEDITIGPD
jgi:PKD repeat protein